MSRIGKDTVDLAHGANVVFNQPQCSRDTYLKPFKSFDEVVITLTETMLARFRSVLQQIMNQNSYADCRLLCYYALLERLTTITP